MQETSLEAYEDIKNKVGLKQLIVYQFLEENEGSTDMEIADGLNLADPNKIRPRRNELVKKGLVTEIYKRACKITGRRAIVWDINKIRG